MAQDMKKLAQRVVVETAMEKLAKDGKDLDRADLLDMMTENWKETGTDRLPVSFSGTSKTGSEVSIKTATVTLTMAKAHWAITDMDALMDYAIDAGMADPVVIIVPGREQAVLDDLKSLGHESYVRVTHQLHEDWATRLPDGDAVDMETGELVPGVEWVPEYPKGLTIRSATKDPLVSMVDRALKQLNIGSLKGLLEGGQDA